jgi:hypothetical protein
MQRKLIGLYLMKNNYTLKTFKCQEMRIQGTLDKSLQIYYENCNIENVYILVQNKEQADEHEKNLSIVIKNSIVGNFYFRYPDPLKSDSLITRIAALSSQMDNRA